VSAIFLLMSFMSAILAQAILAQGSSSSVAPIPVLGSFVRFSPVAPDLLEDGWRGEAPPRDRE